MNLDNYHASRRDGAILSVECDIPASEIGTAYRKALKNYASNVTIPGFRKGKGPEKTVEERYRPGIIEMAEENLLRAVLKDAMTRESIDPDDILAQKIEEKGDFDPADSMKLRFQIEYIPSMAPHDYKGITIKRPKPEVTDEMIAAELGHMAEQHAMKVPVERPAKTGDFVLIDFEGFREDGTPLPNAKHENFYLELGSGRFIPGFEDGLVGASAENERELHLKFPADYNVEELRAAPVRFRVKVHAVKEKSLPEITDDFAVDLNYENLEALKTAIKAHHLEEQARKMREDMEADLLDRLRASNPIPDLPRLMLDAEEKRRAEAFQRMVASMRMKPEEYFEAAKTSQKEWDEGQAKLARETVHSALVLRAIAKAEKITVTSEDISRAITHTALHSDRSPQVLADKLVEEGKIGELKFDILKRKALHFILENAEIDEAA